MTVGEFIKEKRLEKEMSQRDLAAAANLSNAEISRIESGMRKSPSPDVLKTLSAALGISWETLYAVAGYIDAKPATDEPVPSAPTINENDYICVSDLTKEEIEDVKKYIQFLKFKR